MTNFSAKMYGHLLKLPKKLKVARNFYSNCPKNYNLPEFKGGQCPPGPPTSYAYVDVNAKSFLKLFVKLCFIIPKTFLRVICLIRSDKKILRQGANKQYAKNIYLTVLVRSRINKLNC